MATCVQSGMKSGLLAGGITAAVAGVAVSQATLPWVMIKKVALPIALGAAVGVLVYYGKKTSCNPRVLAGLRGKIRCPKVKGVSKAVWKRAIAVELEHTKNRETARCIAAAHLEESPRYYMALAKMEKGLKA